MVERLVEMTDEQMVADRNELVRKYNALQLKYIGLASVLREFREATKNCHEIIAEHDDWEQLNQQKLNSTNEER